MSLIMPIILGIIMLLMYLGFYANDRAVLEEAAMESAIYTGANYSCEEQEMEKIAVSKCKEITDKKLFAMKNVSFEVKKESNYIYVYGNGDFQIPMFENLRKAIWGTNISIKAVGKGAITKPVKNIYIMRGVIGGWS